jgi:hypothetical protein
MYKMPDCPLCKKTLYDFSTLIRHCKTHKLLLAKRFMSSEECQKACETQCPLVWKWNAKKTTRDICICAVCGKGAHCYREKKMNFIKETITDNEGKEKHVMTSYPDRFYNEHQLVCKAKFPTVAYLFDSTKKKPRRTRAKSNPKKVQNETPKPPPPSKNSESQMSEIKDSIATHFDTIFDKYDYETDENESDEEELLEARQERAKQRSLTVSEMISEISKQFSIVQKKVRTAKEAGKREMEVSKAQEIKELSQEISDLMEKNIQKNDSIFKLEEELREHKRTIKRLQELLQEKEELTSEKPC